MPGRTVHPAAAAAARHQRRYGQRRALSFLWLKGLLFEFLLLLLPTVVQALELLLFAADTFDTSVKLFRCALLHRSSAGPDRPAQSIAGICALFLRRARRRILEGFFSLLLGPIFQF